MIEAYDLCTLEPLAEFSTVSPVVQLAYNCVGDCIVTLEKKHPTSPGFVRVYFKWRGLSADKPMRILMASIPRGAIPSHQNQIAAEIVELPSDSGNSVSCLACCEHTGRIAVGMNSLLRVFSLEMETPSSPSSATSGVTASLPTAFSSTREAPPTPNIEQLLDIELDFPEMMKVSIVGDYIAVVSTEEVRVLKLSLFHAGGGDLISDYHQPHGNGGMEKNGEEVAMTKTSSDIVEDQNFVSWSPAAVWEAERKAFKARARSTSSQRISHLEREKASDMSANKSIHGVATRDSTKSPQDHKQPPPRVGTINLASVSQAAEKLEERTTMEVLGPVEHVWGRPLRVSVNPSLQSQRGSQLSCRVLTMLYRRSAGRLLCIQYTGT